MIKKNNYLFWITGLPGSGKTTIAKKIHNKIKKKIWSNNRNKW